MAVFTLLSRIDDAYRNTAMAILRYIIPALLLEFKVCCDCEIDWASVAWNVHVWFCNELLKVEDDCLIEAKQCCKLSFLHYILHAYVRRPSGDNLVIHRSLAQGS